MKKLFILFFLLIFSVVVFSETIDSLKTRREVLYQQYSEINSPGKELSKKEMSEALSVLKDLVIVDTRIITAFGSADEQLRNSAKALTELKSSNEELVKEKEKTSKWLLTLYFIGGGIVALLLVMIIFLIIILSKYSKSKKKLLAYAELLKTADDDRATLNKLKDYLTQKEKEMQAVVSHSQQLKNELAAMEEKTKTLEESLSDYQKAQQAPSEYSSQVDKVNINMSKMEKLMRMKELGIVTEEEFNSFKQKFLGEM